MKFHKPVCFALVTLAFAACVVEPADEETTDVGVQDDMPTIDEILASGGKADLWDDIAICHYVCKATRAPGHTGCWAQQQCAQFCGNYATTLHGDALMAYVMCAVENPLCYQNMEQCMWGRLFAEPQDQHVVLQGAGYGDDNGKTLYAVMDRHEDIKLEATVAGGGFQLEWNLSTRNTNHLVMFFIDRDNDGVCTPGVDLAGTGGIGVSGDWLDPYFYATVTPQDHWTHTSDWPCSTLNEHFTP